MFFNKINKFISRTAIIDEEFGAIKYGDLIKYANQISYHISQRAVVFLIGSNTMEWISGYIGFLRKKAIIIIIDEEINKKSFKKLIRLYKPNYIYKPSNILNITCYEKFKFFKYHLLKTKNNFSKNINKELSILMSTSGTLGSPKFVRISNENINNNTNAISEYLQIKKNDKLITTLKPSYIYGLSMINTHLNSGACIILTNSSITQKKFWEILKKFKATTFGGAPFIFHILDKLKLDRLNLKTIKYITQAGGPLNKDIFSRINNICEKLKIKFITMYGQTEASPRMSYLPHQYNDAKPTSIGKAIKGGKFKIIDEKKKEIKEYNSIGELVYEGKNVCLGYAENIKDLQKGDENKGILYTGDLGFKDKDNFFFIKGRKKRFVKMYGYRISLDDLELGLKDFGFDCVCIGNDQKIKIFFTCKKKENKIKEVIKNNFKIQPSNLLFEYIKKIPIGSNGKILYKNLKILNGKN